MARKSRKHMQNSPFGAKPPTVVKKCTAGIYARTSSNNQPGDSIENQRLIAESYIREHPDIEFCKFYKDFGISSFERIRPGFEEMMLDIESKSINCVIVKDISRFTRDYLEAGEYLQKKFPLWDVRFISVIDAFDSLHDDSTKLELVIKSLLSFHYSVDLSKKIKLAIYSKQKAGTYIPARLPYGYKKTRAGCEVEWSPDETSAPIVQQIFKLAASGLSAYAIAGNLNRMGVQSPKSKAWSSGSVLRILRDVSYTGTFVTKKTCNNLAFNRKTFKLRPDMWIRHHGHHPALIGENTFNTVQCAISGRTTFCARHEPQDDFFVGKLFCGFCGRKMRQKRASNGNKYYICPQKDAAASSCSGKARSEAKLKKQVFIALSEKISDLHTCYQKTEEYEKSPYFTRKKADQEAMIQVQEQEYERLFQVYKRVFVESVKNHTVHSADMRGLLKHLGCVRSELLESVEDLERRKFEYQSSESSSSAKFLPFLLYHGCSELEQPMLEAMAERIYVDISGVRVIECQLA